MNVVKIIANLFAIVFLGFLIYVSVQADRYGFAVCLAIVFLLVAQMPGIDSFKFKFGKDKSIEAKNEPQD
jgi:hypothetical protein